MGDRELSAGDVARMRIPPLDAAKSALAAGRPNDAAAIVGRMADDWRALQEYHVNWIASLLTYIGEHLGEEAVEEALRRTGNQYVVKSRYHPVGPRWRELPAAMRAKVIARTMQSGFSDVEVDEDDEKIALTMRCETGGRLIDEGRYEGDDAYLTLKGPLPRTFMRDEIPVFCSSCAIHNEIQPIEWGDVPVAIEYPTEGRGGRCVYHVYKDLDAVPDEAYLRLGKEPPAP